MRCASTEPPPWCSSRRASSSRSASQRTGDTASYSEILARDWIDIPLAPGQEQGPAGMLEDFADLMAQLIARAPSAPRVHNH